MYILSIASLNYNLESQTKKFIEIYLTFFKMCKGTEIGVSQLCFTQMIVPNAYF